MTVKQAIKMLGIQDMDEHEAECIAYAWMLKTKLYMMGETSRKWNKEAKRMLKHEIGVARSSLS